MEKFLEPSFKKIINKDIPENPNRQEFHIEKLDRGFGNTLGVALRRTLISSVPGAAIFAVEIKGVNHEFQAIDNVKEDMVQLILNLKEIVIEADDIIINPDEVYELTLKSSKGKVTAGQFVVPAGITIVNTDFVIANTSKEAALDIKIYVAYSKGFKTFHENRVFVKEILGEKKGLIAIDSNYSPVKNANYKVEVVNPGESRVFERLVLDVETKGNTTPEEAVSCAGAILRVHYSVFEEMQEVNVNNYFEEEVIEEPVNLQLTQSIESLNLSVRSENALKLANIKLVEDLIDRTVSALGEIKNLGEKSKTEIIQIIQDMGLSFKSE